MNSQNSQNNQYFSNYIAEKLTVVKMNLPTKSKYFNLNWNDSFKQGHDLFSRIQRTGLSRKEAIETIVRGIDAASQRLKKNDGVYIIDFKTSKFYISVYMESDFETINIKTILSYDMILRKKDVILTVNETEELLDVDLSEFYKDGFVNAQFGSLLIEESVDRKQLDVFIDNIISVEE